MPSNEQQTVGAAIVPLDGASRDIDRIVLIIENRSAAAQIIYVDTVSDVSATKGIAIVAGGNLVMERKNGYPTSEPWWVIASGAGALVNTYEGYPDPHLPQPGNGGGGGGNGGNGGGDPPDPPGMNTPKGGDC